MNFSNLSTQLEGVEFRRSRLCDAEGLSQLLVLRSVSEDGIPAANVFNIRTSEDFVGLIQTSYLCITAVSTVKKGLVVGFLALTDAPRHPSFPGHRWDTLLHGGLYTGFSKGLDVGELKPCNTLWVSMLLAPPTQSHLTGVPEVVDEELYKIETEMLQKDFTPQTLTKALFSAALTTTNQIEHLLMALGEPFDIFDEFTFVVPRCLSSDRPNDFTYEGELLYMPRGAFIPHLQLRDGRIEDYDDFVPLLVSGVGVITELPKDMYLEEILKDQDETHKVAIAENPVTHEVVALACLHALSLEEQQLLTKQYATDVYGKLRPMKIAMDGGKVPGHTANTVQIDFLYIKPSYEGSSHELLEFIFEMFPNCEFSTIHLPHSIAEPQLLRNFIYLPVRHYQPHNTKGEFLPVPEGLWASCRYSLTQVRVEAVRSSEERVVTEGFLALPLPDLSDETRDLIREDLCLSLECERKNMYAAEDQLPNTAVFHLMWNTVDTVGIASARRLSVKDMYALRANYDLDAFIHYNTHTPKDYNVTDINLTAKEGMEKFYTSEMRGVLVRTMYVRPAFRNRIRLFLREIMRAYHVQVVLVLPMLDTDPFQPLARELITARPRRVVELSREEKIALYREGKETPQKKKKKSQADASQSVQEEEEEGEEEEDEEEENKDEEGDPLECSHDVRNALVDEDAVGSLLFTTARCLGDEKLRVNTRVVVVGAGATGLAFLHKLVSTPFTHFTNLLLVSTDGLPVHANQEPSLWKTDTMELLEREHIGLQIAHPVRVVTGTLVDMDKMNKFISVDNGTFEPYDFLVLTTGRQYVTPAPIRQLLQQDGRTPKNSVISLSGELALDRFRHTLSEIDNNPNNTDNVIVYGSALDAFAVASSMIDENFAAQRIIVCCPQEDVPPHMDAGCYQAAVTLLRSMGTNVLRGYDVNRLEFDDDGNLGNVLLAPVNAEGDTSQGVELACCLIACVEDKDIDVNILSTLNKRSIVFDGRVIVDHNNRTTDPFVFAAGPVAMLTRRYGATPSFEDFNARDVGYKLANVVMGFMGFDEFYNIVAPGGEETPELLGATNADNMANLYSKVLEESGSAKAAQKTKNADAAKAKEALTPEEEVAILRKKLPNYTTPLARLVRFPRGYEFFSVRSIDFDVEKCEALSCDNLDPSQYLPAGFGDDDGQDDANARQEGLITIYINKSSRSIESITYFGNGEVELFNYGALIGFPETILNLSYRYQEALLRVQETGELNIPTESELTTNVLNGKLDIINYLRLPHLQTVFYDKFSEFFTNLRNKMRTHEESMKLREVILKKHEHDPQLSKEDVATFQKELTRMRSQFRYEVQLALITFLHENKDFRRQNMFLPSVTKLAKKNQPILSVR